MSAIIFTVILIVYLTYRFGTRNFDYWRRKSVKHEQPVFFFGNMYKQFTQRTSLLEQIREWRGKFPEEKYIGVHMGNELGLILQDSELIKGVLVSDSQFFHQRGVNSHKHAREPFYNLFTADSDFWKLSHQRVTPAFSRAKIKAMFPVIERAIDKMLLDSEAGSTDVKELMVKYTANLIDACGFVEEFNGFNESSLFRSIGKRFCETVTQNTVAYIVKHISSELLIHVNSSEPEINKSPLNVAKRIIKQRNYMESGKNYLTDMILEVKQGQERQIDGEFTEHFHLDEKIKIDQTESDDLIIAQAFTIFEDGLKTSAMAINFLLHELALNSKEQERCHAEIDKVLKTHQCKISFEAVEKMVYLKMAFKEALRLHTSPEFLLRKCAKKYTFPGTALTIDEGVYVMVPLQVLHRDPHYFENPDMFRPDRFANDGENVHKYVYMPFGSLGTCTGESLVTVLSLAGVATLLSRFRVQLKPTNYHRPNMDPSSSDVDKKCLHKMPIILVRREDVY